MLLTAGNTFAQSTPGIELEQKYSTILEPFFQDIQEKKYEEAYAMTSKDFHTEMNFETFQKMMNATGITSFTEKKWTNVTHEVLGLFPLISGEFTTPQEVHQLQFRLLQEGEGLKIRDISETITLTSLKKRFPKKEAAKELFKKDLTAILDFFAKNQPRDLYNYLSDDGKKNTKFLTLKTFFQKMKKEKIDVSLPKTGRITILNPSITPQGFIKIKGSYKNEKFAVQATLIYSYRWEWVFNGFSFSAKPVK